MPETVLAPSVTFTQLPSDEQIARTAQALESRNIHALIAVNGEEARRLFFELIPDGAEVFLGTSVTLEQLGIRQVIDQSGRFDAVRPAIRALNRQTQGREIRKLGAAPDFAAGSVNAVTQDGQVLLASYLGSQLGPYASGAGQVIWVVGAQKIVPDLETGLRRIQEYCYPLEVEHARQAYNMDSGVNKVLIINREVRPGRLTLILVKEVLGF